MPTIKVLPHPEYCPQGREIEAKPGESICEALLENGIDDRARLRDELRLHDLPRRRPRRLSRRSASPTRARKTCSIAPGASSRRRGCRARRSWRGRTSRSRSRSTRSTTPRKSTEAARRAAPMASRGEAASAGRGSEFIARRSQPSGLIESKNESGTAVSRSAMTARPSSISTKARISDFFSPLTSTSLARLMKRCDISLKARRWAVRRYSAGSSGQARRRYSFIDRAAA